MSEQKEFYNFSEIERRWQDYWEQNKTFKANDADKRTKFYVLDMFPYPSGQGLHVGHPEGYTASDIIARYKRMNDFNVMHPMGWDAFGLPAEQRAVETGTEPKATTKKNISNMRRQIKSLGFSYDWDREFSTTDPEYYKWTQWVFLKFFNSYFDEKRQKAKPIEQLPIPDGLTQEQKQDYVDRHRLAYEAEAPVNWCPALGTVLANEEVIGGVSERGEHPVVRKPMRQWMLRITKYAERLLADLKDLDWPESIKKLQIDWVGKSVGAEVNFKLHNRDDDIWVFTTRPDTLFGATYMVMAPEHPLVDKITTPDKKQEIDEYKNFAAKKSDLDRTDLAKEKTGVFTGAYAINPVPVNQQKIPIWISDYVLLSYGTGAIMAVPAHDERDFEFAKKFNLEIIPVVDPGPDSVSLGIEIAFADYTETMTDKQFEAKRPKLIEELRQKILSRKKCYTGEGLAINSGQFNDTRTDQFKMEITKWLEERGLGRKAVNYKLRDWLFSRQRYWGEPFPILHTADGRKISLSENDLPLILPKVESYKPAGSGEPPLAKNEDWVNVTLPNGTKAKRETNTMPQWAGSCWYYLRFIDPKNKQKQWDPEKEKYWMPVDLYIGGAEHAVLHLLYARFWHKFLYDLGYVSTKEPFRKLVNQGMILGEDGQKMSKSRGNVINPDKIIAEYGADSMRLYEMFMGPLEAIKPWSMNGLQGVYRFLNKVWKTIIDENNGKLQNSIKETEPDEQTLKILHQTIKKVTNDIQTFSFNTAISQMMIFINHLSKQDIKPKSAVVKFVLILSPFAPHIAEELWQRLGHKNTLAYETWPKFRDELTKEKEIELAVQINGKIKDKIIISANADKKKIEQKALNSDKIRKALDGKEPKKIIVVKLRLVNIVV